MVCKLPQKIISSSTVISSIWENPVSYIWFLHDGVSYSEKMLVQFFPFSVDMSSRVASCHVMIFMTSIVVNCGYITTGSSSRRAMCLSSEVACKLGWWLWLSRVAKPSQFWLHVACFLLWLKVYCVHRNWISSVYWQELPEEENYYNSSTAQRIFSLLTFACVHVCAPISASASWEPVLCVM